LPGVQGGFDAPTEENANHVAAPKGSKGGADHHDWVGEHELEKHEGEPGFTFEGNYTANVHPEEWSNAFNRIWRVDLRIYGKDQESVCRLRVVLTKVVLDGLLTTDLSAHWNLENFDVGLIEETRSFDDKHLCACNCVSPCGALPLAPCAPEIEVRAEFVGPYYCIHLYVIYMSFLLRIYVYEYMYVCTYVCIYIYIFIYIYIYIYRWMTSSWVHPTGEHTCTR
jgi:hypothetical protein